MISGRVWIRQKQLRPECNGWRDGGLKRHDRLESWGSGVNPVSAKPLVLPPHPQGTSPQRSSHWMPCSWSCESGGWLCAERPCGQYILVSEMPWCQSVPYVGLTPAGSGGAHFQGCLESHGLFQDLVLAEKAVRAASPQERACLLKGPRERETPQRCIVESSTPA